MKTRRKNPDYAWGRFPMGKLRGVQQYGYKLSFDLDGAKMNVTISPVEAVEHVRDRNIPDLDEYRDPEMYADAIPELMEQAGRMEREHAKWVRQGWWPRPYPVEKWSVMVVVVPVPFKRGEGLVRLESDKTFDTLAQAKSATEAALPMLKQRRRPAWLVPEAPVRENPRMRKNMKAPYWFVAEGAGYRLLEHGAPTKTKYKTIAAAKADVSERNNAFRAKHPKKAKKPRVRKNGPTLDRPYYPFAEKEAQYAAYSDAQLHYALADAREAAKAEDEMAKAGHGLSRYGWYADDVHTIAAEIRKRRAPRTRTNGSFEPYAVAQTLRVGDQIEVEFEPSSSTSPNAKRKVTVTDARPPYIYVTSGKVRPRHIEGGALRMVEATREVSYQPTMLQQARKVLAIRRLNGRKR